MNAENKHNSQQDTDQQVTGLLTPDASVRPLSELSPQASSTAGTDAAEMAQEKGDNTRQHSDAVPVDDSRQSGGGIYTHKQKKLLWQLLLFSLAVLLIGQIAIVSFSAVLIKKSLEPMIYNTAEAVSHVMTDRLRYATAELDIPINKLVGLEYFMSNFLDSANGIHYIALQQPSDASFLAHVGLSDDMLEQLKINLPDMVDGEILINKSNDFINLSINVFDQIDNPTILHMGVDEAYLKKGLYSTLYEILIVTLIAYLIIIKLLTFFIESRIVEPLRCIRLIFRECTRGLLSNRFILTSKDEISQLYTALNKTLDGLAKHYNNFSLVAQEVSQAQIDTKIANKVEFQYNEVKERYHFDEEKKVNINNEARIYFPLLLFIFSEEFLRSFIPLLISKRIPKDYESIANLVISFPIVFYMAAVVIVLMLGNTLSKRFSCQSLCLIGILISSISYIATFYTFWYYDLLLCRLLSGIGYGLVFLSGQIWIITQTGKEQYRLRSTTVFVVVLLISSLCGPFIGSVVASKIGITVPFLISALLTLISGFVFYHKLNYANDVEPGNRHIWTMLDSKQWSIVLGSFQFVLFVLFCMMPIRIVLTGLFFFITPLYLYELKTNIFDIGWIMMLYGVFPMILSFFINKIIDKYNIKTFINLIGSIIPLIGYIIFLSISTWSIKQEFPFAMLLLIVSVGYSLSVNVQSYIFGEIVRSANDQKVDQQSVTNTYQLIEYIGFAMGVFVSGIISIYLQYKTTILVIVVLPVVGIIIYQSTILILERKRRTNEYIRNIQEAQQQMTSSQ